MQLSYFRIDADRSWGIGKALCPFDGVPKNFQIGTQTQTVRCIRAEDAGEIEKTDFLASSGKAKVRLRHYPATLAVRHFHAQGPRTHFLSLTNRHVDRRVSRVHPPFSNQPQRSTLRYIITEIDLDIMIARYSLVTTAVKIIQVLLVKGADDTGHVVPVVIYCLGDLVRRLHGGDCQFRRRNNKASVDENISPSWMIHRHQRQLIVVIG